MQHLLPGYDLTVGPDVRGRFMVRLRRPPRGQSAEHHGSDAAEGGDCRRAAGQAGGDDGALAGVITRRPDDCPLANSQISTKTLWSVVRWASRQAGTPERRPGSRPRASGAIRESRQRPYGAPCGRPGGKPAHQGWQPGPCPRASAAIRESRQRPYGVSCGRFGGRPVRQGWQPGPCPRASGAIRESRQRPYGASCGRLRGRPVHQGWQPGPCPQASGAIRESRQRPYGAPCGRPGAGRRMRSHGLPPPAIPCHPT
jgi:hypothetical protein